jgi:hypothetical protein
MNRRDFVKLAAVVPFVPSLAFSNEPEPVLTNRRAKYKQYLSLYADQSTGIAKKFSKLKFDYPAFDVALYGDYFKPKNHPMRLYPGFVYVISTTKGRVLEYQYINHKLLEPAYRAKYFGFDGVNYNVISNHEPIVETYIDCKTSFSRFKPENMTHIKLSLRTNNQVCMTNGYGTSLLEEARIARFEQGQTGDLTHLIKFDEFNETARACEATEYVMNLSRHSTWLC